MKILSRLFGSRNDQETARRLEELDQKAREERQLTRLTRSEFLDTLFQGVIEDVARK